MNVDGTSFAFSGNILWYVEKKRRRKDPAVRKPLRKIPPLSAAFYFLQLAFFLLL